MWNDKCFARDGAFEDVVGARYANKGPSFALQASNNVAAVRQHKEAPPPNNMTEAWRRLACVKCATLTNSSPRLYTRSTKLSTTFFSPAFSNAIVSLLPSIFTTLP